MGVVFFMIFLAIIFFVAVFLIISSIIIIVKWNKQKRERKTPKKWWLVVPTILLIISIIAALFPTVYIGFLRYVNQENTESMINVKTGKILYWPMDSSSWGSTRTWFEMDGIKYVVLHKDLSLLRQNQSNDSFYLEYGKDELGVAVANIKYNPKTSNFFNEFMTWLLSGSTADKLGTSTIYPIISENGFELYHVNAYTDDSLFCPEEKLDSIRNYYLDITNYETQNVTIGYILYSKKDESSGTWLGKPYIAIKKEKMLVSNVYNELEHIFDKERFFDFIDVPEKYIELAEIAAPDTPVNGYDERQVYAYSKDRLAYRHIRLALIENQVYVITSSGSRYIHGYPLRDEEMNQYIIDTAFKD